MTSSRNTNSYPDLVVANDSVALALAIDLEAIHQVPVPVRPFDPNAHRSAAHRPVAVRHWRPLALGVIAVTILAAAVLIPATWGGETETVSAEEILANAHAALEEPAGYHRTYRTTAGGGPALVGEVWYRGPAHFRMELRDSIGQLVMGHILNGDEGWQYFSDGQLRVIHHGPNSAFVENLRGAVNPNSSLEQALGYLEECGMAPVAAGETTVVGRPAYIIERCDSRIWIDKESFFILGIGPASAGDHAPNVVELNRFSAETLGLEWDIVIPDDTFDYEPPPGVVVTEQDF